MHFSMYESLYFSLILEKLKNYLAVEASKREILLIALAYRVKVDVWLEFRFN